MFEPPPPPPSFDKKYIFSRTAKRNETKIVKQMPLKMSFLAFLDNIDTRKIVLIRHYEI